MIRVMKTPQEHEQSGRALVASGDIVKLRERLRLTRSAMAEMLHMSTVTYYRCEDEPQSASRMWRSTAARLGRFAYLAEITLAELATENVRVQDLTPLHMVAVQYGMPQEVLLHWYRNGTIHAEDLGILGLWIHRDDLHYLQEAL